MPTIVKNGNVTGKRQQSVTGTKTRSKRRKNDVGCTQKASAILTRLLFLLHTGIALWRVSLLYPIEYLYFLSIGVTCLLLEMIFTLAVRQGKEYKWFCPSVFFYLASIVPCLWFLELNQMNTKLQVQLDSGGCVAPPAELTNTTIIAFTSDFDDKRFQRDTYRLENDMRGLARFRVKRQEIDSNNSTSNKTKRKRKRKGKRMKNRKKNRMPKRPSTTSAVPKVNGTISLRITELLSAATSTAAAAKTTSLPNGMQPGWTSTLVSTNKTSQTTIGTKFFMNVTTEKLSIMRNVADGQPTQTTANDMSRQAGTLQTEVSYSTQQNGFTPTPTFNPVILSDSKETADNQTQDAGFVSQSPESTSVSPVKATTKFVPLTVSARAATTANEAAAAAERTTASAAVSTSLRMSSIQTRPSAASDTWATTSEDVESSPPGISSRDSTTVLSASTRQQKTLSFSTTQKTSTTPQMTSEMTQMTTAMISSTTGAQISTKRPSKGNDIKKIGDTISQFSNNAIQYLQNTTQTVNAFLSGVNPENWLLALHQVLLFVLVIGRWLLPKGEITRDQLSQLLLVFIGVGADILEFVTETIDDDVIDVRCNRVLHFIIYAVWSWSLLQFTLVLTAAKSRKTRVGFDTDSHVTMVKQSSNCCTKTIFNDADLWGILVTMLLQDLPFLAFRLYMMIVYNQVHQMMVFFTGKNFLVVILQVYRLIVLQLEHKNEASDDVTDTELQPLKGTLHRLASQARAEGVDSSGDIKNASFKSRKDGSVVVKIHLESEESVKRKNSRNR